MKVQIEFKDPDLQFPEMDEKQLEQFKKDFSEHGEYYRFVLDTVTLEGRLIPKRKWK